MISGINLPTVFISNLMGFLLGVLMLKGNLWKQSTTKHEQTLITMSTILIIVACVLDPFVFYIDGRPGSSWYYVNYYGNFWLFLSTLSIAPAFLQLVETHLTGYFRKSQKILSALIFSIGLLMLIVNFFNPILFSVNENNIYVRGPLHSVFTCIMMLFIVDSISVYITVKQKGGILKFFPMWLFVIPIILGTGIQACNYGVSTIWPFMSIALTELISNLQNEVVYIDQLTCIYNRSFLDSFIQNQNKRKKGGYFTAIMLDMNNFKQINDIYGHSTGDKALIDTARVLRESVGPLGCVMRYAGDEFVIFLNTREENIVKNVLRSINMGLERLSADKDRNYKLSVSSGYSVVNLKTDTMETVMDEIDHKMYENKRAYYEKNPQADRRHSQSANSNTSEE